LVDAMFMLSRAEAHGLPLRREPVYVNDIVAECARSMRVIADQDGGNGENRAKPGCRNRLRNERRAVDSSPG
jgi:hypothetical protein